MRLSSTVHDGELFLLTPLREGRPCTLCPHRRAALISTHAPAGGATGKLLRIFVGFLISTHAPAGGATDAACSRSGGAIIISTHAPAGGATVRVDLVFVAHLFLLTPLREGRLRPLRSNAG